MSVGLVGVNHRLPHPFEKQGHTGCTRTAVSGPEKVAAVLAAGGKFALDHLNKKGEGGEKNKKKGDRFGFVR
jgi:hypothetical protein